MIYCWVITKDHIADETKEAPCNSNAKGMYGPSAAKDDDKNYALESGVEFKMYDDDETLCYEGKLVGTSDITLFEPLDDFGMPNAGCTGIKYLSVSSGEWAWL